MYDFSVNLNIREIENITSTELARTNCETAKQTSHISWHVILIPYLPTNQNENDTGNSVLPNCILNKIYNSMKDFQWFERMSFTFWLDIQKHEIHRRNVHENSSNAKQFI